MQKIIEKILAQKSEYQYEIESIDECTRIKEKIQNIVYPSFHKDLPILKVSELLKIYFYLYIPFEKWFLISEIMDDLVPYIDDKPEVVWFELFCGIEQLDKETLDNYIFGIHEFLNEDSIESLISVDVDSFLEKYYQNIDENDSYDLSIVLAILIKNNFLNIFENLQDFQKKNTTVDGVRRLFSFLILFSIIFEKLKEEYLTFKGFLGVLSKYNSCISQFNLLLRQNKIKLSGLNNKLIVTCNVNDSRITQLAKNFNEYHEMWTKIESAYHFFIMCQESERLFSTRRKELYAQISYLKDIVCELSKTEDFYPLSSSITKLENKNLQKQILLKIQEINLASGNRWRRKFRKYKRNDFEQLRLLLNQYYCHPENLSDSEKQKITSICTLEKVKEMIEALENSAFDWKPFYFQILTTTSINRIEKIDYYLKRKYMNVKVLNEHIEYFDIHSSSFDQFERNLRLLEEKDILVKDVSKKTFSIFLEESNQLEKRLDLHESYQTSFQNNSMNNYDYLLYDQSFDMYDELIELGFLDYIRKNPYLLIKQNKSVGRRIRLMREIGYDVEGEIPNSCFMDDIFSISDLNQYFEDDYVFISDDILEKHSRLEISPNTLSMSIIRNIDSKYLSSDSLYLISGIPVSRNRFLRNFEVFKDNENLSTSEKVLRAFIYTPYSGYTKEEIDILKNELITNKCKMIDVK